MATPSANRHRVSDRCLPVSCKWRRIGRLQAHGRKAPATSPAVFRERADWQSAHKLGFLGLGMSAGGSPDGIVLCSPASLQTASEPARDDGRQKPTPAPQCPFCFVAAQSAGHIATIREAPAFLAYAGLLSNAILNDIGAGACVFQLHHSHGDSPARQVE
jgi:hypothetical protein